MFKLVLGFASLLLIGCAAAAPVPPTIGTGPMQGTLYHDVSCTSCQRFMSRTYPIIREQLIDSGKLTLQFVDYPVEGHSMTPHLAALCAHDQGKYTQMLESIYGSPEAIKSYQLAATAERIGLQLDQYTACMNEQRHLGVIQANIAASRSTIQETPTLIIDGQAFGSAHSATDIITAVTSQ